MSAEESKPPQDAAPSLKAAAKPPWRGLFEEAALRRLVRMAALRPEDRIVWLGAGGERAAKVLGKIAGCSAELRETLEGLPLRAVDLLVAPELAGQVGVDAALSAARPAIETDGLLAIVARSFLGPDVPEPLRVFWERRQVGALQTVKATLARFSALGYEPLTAELLPEPSLEKHDQALYEAAQRASQSEAMAEAEAGVRHGTVLGMFVGRRVEPDAPPRWPRRGTNE